MQVELNMTNTVVLLISMISACFVQKRITFSFSYKYEETSEENSILNI